jgi:ABC-type glycerol-3-phosphate transport system substrate-binding protein
MKRLLSLILVLALLGLCGCGEAAESARVSQAQPAPSLGELTIEDGYIIPSAWTETSINDGTWGYVTAGTGLSGDYSIQNGYLTAEETVEDGIQLTQLSLEGQVLCQVTIPSMEVTEGADQYISFYCFGEDDLWLIHDSILLVDESTGETEQQSYLEHWSLDGQQLLSLDLSEVLDMNSEEEFAVGLSLSPDGLPLLTTTQRVCFLGEDGTLQAQLDQDGSWLSFVQDKDGRVYLWDSSTAEVYTMDWDSHTLGQLVLTTDSRESVLTGGGDYDLLLVSDTGLRGVSLQTGTMTEILSWLDWGLDSMVGGVACLEDGTFLISTYDIILKNTDLLTLSQVPADQVQEKMVLHLAVGMGSKGADLDLSTTDALDDEITAAIAKFNRGSAEYQVEITTFADGTDLQMQLLGGDAPDLIYWDSRWTDSPAYMQIMAKKSYLTDLEPLFQSDPDISLDVFLPGIVEAEQTKNGGLYAMPTFFYFRTLAGLTEYVGAPRDWNYSDLLELAESKPEDMTLFWSSRTDFLETLLRSSVSQFADIQTGTCDFQNQDFYDLLTLCRNYLPEEEPEYQGEDVFSAPGLIGKQIMLMGVYAYGSLTGFAQDYLEPLSDGVSFLGYPDTEGNGTQLLLRGEFSICAQSSNADGAWTFLRSLYDYDLQYGIGRFYYSIRQDAFEARLDSWWDNAPDCTEEQKQQIKDLVYGACQDITWFSPVIDIILEEVPAFFAGDKTAQETADIIENRVNIYLSEQS